MMYLSKQRNSIGNYSNGQSTYAPDLWELTPEQEAMLTQYSGFVSILEEPDPDLPQSQVTMRPNLEAWEKWKESQPPQSPAELEDPLAQEVRLQRNLLLAATDWTQTLDSPLDPDTQEQVKEYRNLLRNITSQPNFPEDIQWPQPPISLSHPMTPSILS